jgi:hypothetical protein
MRPDETDEQRQKRQAFNCRLLEAALKLAVEERLGHAPEDGWMLRCTPEDSERAGEIVGECYGNLGQKVDD